MRASNSSVAADAPGRCNRPKSDVRQRSQIIAVRVTPEEHERFTALAARHHKSLPELMRLALEGELLAESIQQAQAMGWK